jgi:glycosyltransferase involved in cell wall biosynthesis
MRIAVITPYYKEEDKILEQCHSSVREQTLACDHILIADGFPSSKAKKWHAKHLELPYSHGHGGNVPRVLGSITAFKQGYDAISFLDADNWYKPDHLERLVDLQVRTGAAVCTASRSMHRIDGSYMFDDDKNDGCSHVDTSCLFLTAPALPIVTRWALMPGQLGGICDTIYWSSIKSSKLLHAHEPSCTVCFRTTYEADYRRLHEPLPAEAKLLEDTDRPFYWFKSLPAKDRWRVWKDLGWPYGTRSAASVQISRIIAKLTHTLGYRL